MIPRVFTFNQESAGQKISVGVLSAVRRKKFFASRRSGWGLFSSPAGFTLVEVMLAMLILSSGVVLLTQSWSGSFLRLRKTKTNTELASLLQRKMLEVDLKYRGGSLESIPEEEGDDFGSDYPEYRWELKSRELEFPNLSSILTARDGGANETLIMVMSQLTDHLSKSVKEIKVIVYFKPESGKEVSNSIVTYYVDFKKELAIAEALGGSSK